MGRANVHARSPNVRDVHAIPLSADLTKIEAALLLHSDTPPVRHIDATRGFAVLTRIDLKNHAAHPCENRSQAVHTHAAGDAPLSVRLSHECGQCLPPSVEQQRRFLGCQNQGLLQTGDLLSGATETPAVAAMAPHATVHFTSSTPGSRNIVLNNSHNLFRVSAEPSRPQTCRVRHEGKTRTVTRYCHSPHIDNRG